MNMKQFTNNIKLSLLRIPLMLGLMVCVCTSYGQSSNSNWKQELTTAVNEFVDCKSTSDETELCVRFFGESLTKVYSINDFYSEVSKRYLKMYEITKFLEGNDQWTELGHAYDPKILAEAQNAANTNRAAVAVYKDSSTGLGQHVALIIPGELQHSGSWGMAVPNTASFLSVQPEKSYTNKALSYAFRRDMMKDVFIYVRNN